MFMRVGADGTAQIYSRVATGATRPLVGAGSSVAVSPDGATLRCCRRSVRRRPRRSWCRDGGAFTAVPVPGGDPIGIALGNNRLFVSTMSAAEGGGDLVARAGWLRREAARQAGLHRRQGRHLWADAPSPDGLNLLYAAESDDGYSRMWLVPTAGVRRSRCRPAGRLPAAVVGFAARTSSSSRATRSRASPPRSTT